MEYKTDCLPIRNPYVDREEIGRMMVAAPSKLLDLALAHVREIFERGYAKEVSKRDFFHGHILIEEPVNPKNLTLEECLYRPPLILYHTREWMDDWVKGSKKNVPRSIVGLPNGELVLPGPTKEQRSYERYGTISSSWPFTLNGRVLEAHSPIFSVESGDGTAKMFNGLIYFLESDLEKPRANGQINLDFYLGLSN